MSQPTFHASTSSDIIASLPLFAGMEPDLLRGLITSARISKQEKGEIFLLQNQPFSRFYVVLDGWCAISKGNKDGQESILQILTHGDFLPDPEMTEKNYSPFNVQALTPVSVLMLPPTIVRNALQHSTVLIKNMLLSSSRRTQELRDHIEQLTLRTAEERVGRFLLQMRLHEQVMTGEITLPFDKNFIASYLGIKPETLSRSLQIFKERGFVIQRNHVTAPDFEALCDFCDSTIADKCHQARTEDCPNPSFSPASA